MDILIFSSRFFIDLRNFEWYNCDAVSDRKEKQPVCWTERSENFFMPISRNSFKSIHHRAMHTRKSYLEILPKSMLREQRRNNIKMALLWSSLLVIRWFNRRMNFEITSYNVFSEIYAHASQINCSSCSNVE